MTKSRKKLILSNHQEIAEVFGRSLDTVKVWSRQGMPGRQGHYDVGKIFTWLFSVGPWATEQSKSDILQELTADAEG